MAYDVVVIGAGAAGEAAGSLGAEIGGRVAVVERDLVGGQCTYWACMPSKTLLDAAFRRGIGADYPWERASRRRDWMISREGIEYPDDSPHVKTLEDAGARFIRGSARVVGPGRVEVLPTDGRGMTLETAGVVIATGSAPIVPEIRGLEESGYWTSPQGTSLRELPSSILIMGGGPVGVEMAQVYQRFGVKTTLIQSEERVLPRDHPRSSAALGEQLRREGVNLRLGVKGVSVEPGGNGRRVTLTDGSVVEAAEILVAIGRRARDIREMVTDEVGVDLGDDGTPSPDEHLGIGESIFVAGDAAGGLQFTHVADYEGRVAVRAALGQRVRADLGSVPRTTYTDPETSAVGRTESEAAEEGIDAFEVTQDFATTARGYTIEGSHGHVTAVIDRERGILVGAFAACRGASELIHEAVLAIKHQIPVAVLADTIHAFPTASRVFGNLMSEALKQMA